MRKEQHTKFVGKLNDWATQVEKYVYKSARENMYKPVDIADSVIYYTGLGGKRLRPAVLIASCAATGGNIEKALPAAASVELYHTWTLIHDDIIDRDSKRRHGETAHIKWMNKGIKEYKYEKEYASHFGISIAILAGDVIQGWSVSSLLPQLYFNYNVDPKIVLTLIQELDSHTLSILVEGETLDILFSTYPIENLNQDRIIDMLWKKTGILYRFCGMAGSMIGLNTPDKNNHIVDNVSEFASKCGTAFQLQDDILGIIGDEDILGKPVGSDIREGKRTICLWKAYSNADNNQKRILNNVVGNHDASVEEILNVIDIIRDLDGIKFAEDLAKMYINGGIFNGIEIKGSLHHLDVLEDSEYKDFLINWANYMISRTF